MFCPNCGIEIKENQAFCGVCGAKINDIQPNVASSNNINIPDDKSNVNLNPTKDKKKNGKKVIIPIVAVAIVISLVIGAFTFLNKKNDKWYVAKQTDIRYNSDGEKASTIITSKRADGQITSMVNINEDNEFSTKYVYDEDGKLIKISFNEDDESIGVFDFTYEKVDGDYVGTADGKVDGEYFSFERIYNKKNILIYESIKTGSGDEQTINEKEYNDDGLLLKEHNRYRIFLNNYSDIVWEHKYENGKLLSTAYYSDGELSNYTEYDKDGYVIKNETYDDGELNEKITIDWGKSKYKSNIFDGIGDDITVKHYNGENELLFEVYGELIDNTVIITPKFYDEDIKSEYEEEFKECGNDTFSEAVFNDDKLLTEVKYYSGQKYKFQYNENGKAIKQSFYTEDALSSETLYEWAEK